MKILVTLVFILLPTIFLNGQVELNLVLPSGHNKQVTDFVFSTDGKYIATTAEDHAVIIWDARSGKLVHLLKGHVNSVTSMDFSADGKYLVTCSRDQSISLWDIKTGLVVNQGSISKSQHLLVKFSPNCNSVLVKCANGNISIWKIKENEIVELRPSYKSSKSEGSIFEDIASKNVGFSTDGKYVFIEDDKSNLYVFNTKTASRVYQCTTGNGGGISQFKKTASFIANANLLIVFTKQDKLVIDVAKKDTLLKLENSLDLDFINFELTPQLDTLTAISMNGLLVNWDLNTGKLLSKQILFSKKAIEFCIHAQFNFSSKTAITVSGDSMAKVRLWDFANGIMNNQKLLCNMKANSFKGLAINPRFLFFAVNEQHKNVSIRSLKSGEIFTDLSAKTNFINNTILDSSNAQVITATNDKVIKFWSLSNGKLANTIQVPLVDNDYTLKQSNHSKYLYTWYSNKVLVYDSRSGSLICKLGSDTIYNAAKQTMDKISEAAISPNEKFVCASSSDHSIKIWSLESKQKVQNFYHYKEAFVRAAFTYDSRFMVGLTTFGKIMIWNIATNKIVDSLLTQPLGKGNFFLSETANLLSTELRSGEIVVYDIANKKVAAKFPAGTVKDFITAVFSANNSLIAASSNFSVSILNVATLQKTRNILLKDYSVHEVRFGLQDILISTGDGTLHMFDIQTGKDDGTVFIDEKAFLNLNKVYKDKVLAAGPESFYLLDINTNQTVRVVPIKEDGYIIQADANWYTCSTDAAKWISWKSGSKVYDFNQLDIRFNRPDKVLESINKEDTLVIEVYKKAYQKRIKKLAIDTLTFSKKESVPEADFINRNSIDYEQFTNELSLQIKGEDSIFLLDRLNVWVNDVSIYGSKGMAIKQQNKRQVDTTISVILSDGENNIQTSITNANGTESYRMPLFVKFSPTIPTIKKMHFIGIGINQFANPEYNLSWSVKDIRDLSFKLKSKYPNIIIDTLFDGNVTKENVLALKKKLLLLNENDKVIVSYSGHGVLSKDLDYYLSTYSINFNNPEEKGLAYDDLESLLDNIKPRQKLMLIDACHSGEVDKDEIAKIEASTKELNNKGVTTKSSIKVIPKKNLGMANSFELMQSLFVNVSKGTGATIISAAGGMQYAQERGDLKNGVFTYSIIEAFNQNQTLKVSELKKKVGERVIQLTNGLQKPTSRNETNNYDWVVW